MRNRLKHCAQRLVHALQAIGHCADEATLREGADQWTLYITLDDVFERLAAAGSLLRDC